MAENNDFGLKSNADQPVSQETAVATIERVAGAPATSDSGVAQADGKKVSDADFREEFDLEGGQPPQKRPGAKEKKTEVKTEVDDDEEEEADETDETDEEGDETDEAEGDEEDEDETKAAAGEDVGEGTETVADWLKEVDLDTRQEILDEFVASNIDDLVIPIRVGGEDYDVTIADVRRAAAGYAGEESVTRKIKDAKADLKRRETDITQREEFFAKQFEDPGDLLTFLDGHVPDPVAYFKALKDHAESVLQEAEDNPAQFRRNSALRRENAQLRSDITDIKNMLTKKQSRDGGRDTDDAEADEGDDETAAAEERRKIGERRRDAVKRDGFDVNDVHEAWIDDGEPVDFDRWYAKWKAAQQKRDTSDKGKRRTKKNRRKGGSALRRRGSAGSGGGTTQQDDGDLSAAGIAKFLRNHPSNRRR